MLILTAFPKADKKWAMHHKTRCMKNAYLIWQNCNFKNVHACVDYDERNHMMCIMRFRFDNIRGKFHREWYSYNKDTKRRIRHEDIKSYNHVGFSLHIPLNHVQSKDAPLKTWGENERVKRSNNLSNIYSANVLAKQYGVETFAF